VCVVHSPRNSVPSHMNTSTCGEREFIAAGAPVATKTCEARAAMMNLYETMMTDLGSLVLAGR